jgi:hypothetical protein
VKPLRTRANDPPCRALPLLVAPSDPGHAPTRPLARCSATRSSGCRGPAGRRFLPSYGKKLLPARVCSSGGAHGVLPFAVLIPLTGGLTSLPCRAHVPFVPAASAPIYFRRGDRPPVGNTSESKRRSIWTRMASTSGLRSRLRSDVTADFWPGYRSCLGLCLLQGFGHAAVHPDRARPRSDHQPPGTHARVLARRAAAHPQSAHGFSASFPTVTCYRETCSVGHIPVCAACWRRGSPSLQRIDGADASPTRTSLETGAGKLPV